MKTLAERSFRRPTDFLPNGCGSGFTSRLIPDEIAGVEFQTCCDDHDLAYHVGGFWGLLTRKPRSDWRLGRCIARRFTREAAASWRFARGGSGIPRHQRAKHAARAAGLWAAGQGLGLAYTLGVTVLGWTPLTWPWRRRPVPSHEALAKLKR